MTGRCRSIAIQMASKNSPSRVAASPMWQVTTPCSPFRCSPIAAPMAGRHCEPDRGSDRVHVVATRRAVAGQVAALRREPFSREKIASQLIDRQAARVQKGAVSVSGKNLIAVGEMKGYRRDRLVARAGELKPAFALTDKNCFPPIALAGKHHLTQEIDCVSSNTGTGILYSDPYQDCLRTEVGNSNG